MVRSGSSHMYLQTWFQKWSSVSARARVTLLRGLLCAMTSFPGQSAHVHTGCYFARFEVRGEDDGNQWAANPAILCCCFWAVKFLSRTKKSHPALEACFSAPLPRIASRPISSVLYSFCWRFQPDPSQPACLRGGPSCGCLLTFTPLTTRCVWSPTWLTSLSRARWRQRWK